jgi:hypothetical protein
VFFKKQNLRDKTLWFLSTFMSFCIQSLVRKALIGLTKALKMLDLDEELLPTMSHRATIGSTLGAKQYLRHPLRLFVASRGNDDLMSLAEPAINGPPDSEDYREARRAIGYSNWASKGISNSGDYLKYIFEDDGTALISAQFQPASSAEYPGRSRLSLVAKASESLVDLNMSTPEDLTSRSKTQQANMGALSKDKQVHGANKRQSTASSSRTGSQGWVWLDMCNDTEKPWNAIFSPQYDLTRHESTGHTVRNVQCSLCTEEMTFTRNDALARHYRVEHPEYAQFLGSKS